MHHLVLELDDIAGHNGALGHFVVRAEHSHLEGRRRYREVDFLKPTIHPIWLVNFKRLCRNFK